MRVFTYDVEMNQKEIENVIQVQVDDENDDGKEDGEEKKENKLTT